MIAILLWVEALLPVAAIVVFCITAWSQLLRLRICMWLTAIAFFGGLVEIGAYSEAGSMYADEAAWSLWLIIGAGGVWVLLRILYPKVRAQNAVRKARQQDRGT